MGKIKPCVYAFKVLVQKIVSKLVHPAMFVVPKKSGKNCVSKNVHFCILGKYDTIL